jgi:ferredoxin
VVIILKNFPTEIIVNENKCSGCLICELICSYTFRKEFSPTKAYIQINTHELTPKISFLEGCTQCGQCVKHCLYGALTFKETEE